jgi:DNA-binding CsgD family transcriptional regulator
MSLRNLIKRLLGQPAIPVDRAVLGELHNLAAQEQRPKEAIANDLLSLALKQRKIAESKLAHWRGLTPREQEVAALASLNYTNRQIARRLSISPATVSTHMRHILEKFELHSKAELRLYLADWDFSAWDRS